MRKVSLIALVFLLAAFGVGAVSQASAGQFPVRALVITMFDPETAPWLAHESLPVEIPVKGAYGPLHCADNGLCVATIGEGKVNAATSLTAILDSAKLDFGRAYFLTAGIGGVSPKTGTIGFAAWARWVVDWDLGHHVQDPDVPHGYLPIDDQGTNVFHLDQRLVDRAYGLTRNLPLSDSAAAVETRTHYAGQEGRKPFVATCDTLTGDDYWAGGGLSETAQYVTDIWTKNQGSYCTTQQEDNATAAALARHGYLDRYLSLRTASNFDQPYPGQSVRELLATYPGFEPAIDNAYLVGSTVVHDLLTHP
ncbi:purine nucleoside permease [Amycolatopsis sp. PS_44_ISF1]|uniref:purine-nucleoside phosphorylase n=1 Tax=Amycolatopsis sp. PS_44_ISF1 TaxID=2974917 RepID=UPI0028DE44B6|nr:purine nucleoside permease [Amycolatopsis sp. PS_44_ISF1]MDT8914940.1 purine nucleoside permease [Amycolatopsis sp. PS_44_ISF1]